MIFCWLLYNDFRFHFGYIKVEYMFHKRIIQFFVIPGTSTTSHPCAMTKPHGGVEDWSICWVFGRVLVPPGQVSESVTSCFWAHCKWLTPPQSRLISKWTSTNTNLLHRDSSFLTDLLLNSCCYWIGSHIFWIASVHNLPQCWRKHS